MGALDEIYRIYFLLHRSNHAGAAGPVCAACGRSVRRETARQLLPASTASASDKRAAALRAETNPCSRRNAFTPEVFFFFLISSADLIVHWGFIQLCSCVIGLHREVGELLREREGGTRGALGCVPRRPQRFAIRDRNEREP